MIHGELPQYKTQSQVQSCHSMPLTLGLRLLLKTSHSDKALRGLISQAFLDPARKPTEHGGEALVGGDNDLAPISVNELLHYRPRNLFRCHDGLSKLRAILDKVMDHGSLNPKRVDDTNQFLLEAGSQLEICRENPGLHLPRAHSF